MDGATITGSAAIPDGPSLDWTIQGIGDFNRDHKADILWRHAFGLVAIWLMDGTAIAGGATIADGPSLDWTIQGIGDFNGDVNADILWRHAFGLVAIWYMDGTTFDEARVVGSVGLDWTLE
jgi:hypothetical protein